MVRKYILTFIQSRFYYILLLICIILLINNYFDRPDCRVCVTDVSTACSEREDPVWVLLEQNTDSKSEFQDKSYRFWPHDPRAVEFVRKSLKPPFADSVPYKLVRPNENDWSQFLQMSLIFRDHLGQKKNGRFLEVGAFDGERFSNTLMLEKYHNWTGVLIEADKLNFQMIQHKRRKAWALNACLLNVQTPTPMKFSFFGPLGGRSKDGWTANPYAKPTFVMCVPLSAVLHALNWTKIDLMVLDTEGTEPEILMSIPWNYVDIDVIQIECNRCNDPKMQTEDFVRKRGFLRTFMDIVGYDEVDYITLDYVYKKRR